MAAEFQDLVASGEYATWVANGDGAGEGTRGTRAVRHLTPGPA
jgi:hypothetical protein